MKKNVIILSVAMGLSTLANIGLWSGYADTDEKRLHAENCWNRSSTLAANLLELYNTTIAYNNEGYQIDDYTLGALNTDVDAYNASKDVYNIQCAGSVAPVLTN